jgi:hypothetical protein
MISVLRAAYALKRLFNYYSIYKEEKIENIWKTSR